METSDEILMRMTSFHPQYIGPDIHRVHRILKDLGNPEKNLPPVIHIAGTNGKGSTLATLRGLLEASGKTVHAFTSPHLVKYHERFYVSGADISEDMLVDALLECERVNDSQEITHFELTAALGFHVFANNPADVLLLEVGLGGTWDATNVIDHPALSVITPVALDHQQFLGNDVATIAKDKSGILKHRCPAVIGEQCDEALDAIREVAEEKDVPLKVFGQDFTVYEEHGRLVYQDEGGLLDLPLPTLQGRHQISNTGTALAAIRSLPDLVKAPAYEEGIRQTTWPARFERLKEGALVDLVGPRAELWLDGGHNPHCGAALAETVATLEERHPKPLYLVTAMMERKDAGGFLSAFSGLARQVRTLSVPDAENSYSAEVLADIARGVGLSAAPMPDLASALKDILAEEKDPRILICGSLYLAGHALRLNAESETV